MWICSRCRSENSDSYATCAQCGAPRAAGRFGAPARTEPPVQAPRISSPAGPRNRPVPDRPFPDPPFQALPPLEENAPMEEDYPREKRSRRREAPAPEQAPAPWEEENRKGPSFLTVLARIVGVLLCILLPALVGALLWNRFALWQQYIDLTNGVLAMLGETAEQLKQIFPDGPRLLSFLPASIPQWAEITCYGFVGLLCELIALLPGLWTLLLARKAPDPSRQNP